MKISALESLFRTSVALMLAYVTVYVFNVEMSADDALFLLLFLWAEYLLRPRVKS